MERELFNCYLIGEDELLLECAEIILSQHHAIVGIISSLPSAEHFATQKNILYFKTYADAYPVLVSATFDYLFSVVNRVIFPAAILDRAQRLAINYHNSPLPKYAGLHAPSWAILNNESIHGVTWHIMAEDIDAGDILKQALIEIDPDETGLSLGIKCYQEAINTFKELIYDLSWQHTFPIPQNLKNRTYFDYYQKPRYGGWINWQESAATIDRICRALNLGHHHYNRLGLPKFSIGTDFFLITQARIIPEPANEAPGTLVKIAPEYWQIATKDHLIQLEHVIPLHKNMPIALNDIAAYYALKTGSQLPLEDEVALLEYECVYGMYAIHELFWGRQLKHFNPGTLPFQSLLQEFPSNSHLETVISFDAAPLFQATQVDNPSHFILAALFIYLHRLGNKERFGIGFSSPKLHQVSEKIAPLFSKIVPCSFEIGAQATAETFLEAFFSHLALLDKHLSFAHDIYYRYPELSSAKEAFYPLAVITGNEVELKKQLHVLNATVVISISNTHKIQWHSREVNELMFQVIRNSMQHLPILIKAMLTQPAMPILKLPLLSQEEITQLILTWNQTQTPYPKAQSVVSLFIEQVQKNSSKIALWYEDIALSYQELHQQSDRVAVQLRQRGVLPGSHIAICTDQKIELIVGLLAILKAGAAYVPMDTHSPASHIQFMLHDSQSVLALTSESIKQKIQICCDNQEIPLLVLGALMRNPVHEHIVVSRAPNDLAYIMYTSGTTGKPKGVMVAHRGIVRLVKDCNYMKIKPEDCIAQAASIGFDAATFEIWGALLNGATLVAMPSELVLDVKQFGRMLIERKITILWLTSALFNEYAVLDPAMFRMLNYLLVGGDVLNAERIMSVMHCEQGAPQHILNGYGPTENTTFTTVYAISPRKQGYQSIPIGKPIANTTVYILDNYLQPVPIGALGELYAGGDGVALGYLNLPERTVARFIPNLYNHNEGLLYKTGDMARWLPDGTIEYLGRLDKQIKIRGFRVDLEAVYTILSHHEFINQCAVHVVENEKQQKQIVAYVVFNDATSIAELQRYMGVHLPPYMRPSFYIKMNKIPLTLNGKVNFQQLPKPDFSLHSVRADYIAPHTRTEKNIAQIWSVLFTLEPIGIHDSFFDLGGHSLMLTQLVLKIKEQFHCDLPLQQFLETPTISHLGQLIDKNRGSKLKTSSLRSHWHFDTQLNMLAASKKSQFFNSTPQAVLLTGANGFLGASIFYQLCHLTTAKIYCLIRGKDEGEAKQKLQGSISFYYPEFKDWQRIQLLVGDLGKPYLGLSIEQFMGLAATIDIIYHNGAMVHHLYSYESLRAANVLSIKELLKLATIKKQIPLHYVSTLSAVNNHTDSFDTIIEDFIYTHPNPPPRDGYSQTKWVAEQVLAKAHQQQCPIKIYRLGWVLGHSSTGIIAAEKNHLLMLIKGCLQLGVAPDWDMMLDILPVDQVSQLIVKTSLNQKIPYNIFNLINPNKFAWGDLMAYLDQRGYRLSLCSPQKWREILATEVTPQNALYSLLTLYINQHNDDWMNGLKKISEANNQNTQHAFNENKMKFPLIDEQILDTYFDYLEGTGFLKI